MQDRVKAAAQGSVHDNLGFRPLRLQERGIGNDAHVRHNTYDHDLLQIGKLTSQLGKLCRRHAKGVLADVVNLMIGTGLTA